MKSHVTNGTPEQNYLWDLTKIAVTSLALLGTAGCKQRSVEEIIKSRPETTPAAVVDNRDAWVGKDITIHATPVLISDRSKLFYSGGKHAIFALDLDLRYTLQNTEESADGPLILIGSRRIFLRSGKYTPEFIATWSKEHVLPRSTYVVSGEVKHFADNQGIYLEYKNSFYHAESRGEGR